MVGAAQGSLCMLVALHSEDRAASQCLVAAHNGSADTELYQHLPSAKGSPPSASTTSSQEAQRSMERASAHPPGRSALSQIRVW